MNTENLHNRFFFEIPLSDVYGVGCSALSLIYYGSRRGVFCASRARPMDLNQVDAFRITVEPRSVSLEDQDREYSLVYYKNKLAEDLWDSWHRRCQSELRRVTRRVRVTDDPTLHPVRLRHLYIPSHHPVYVAKYGHVVGEDYYVPDDYVKKFRCDFEGFLMSSPKGRSLEDELFSVQHLELCGRRDGHVKTVTTPHVTAYSLSGADSHGVPKAV